VIDGLKDKVIIVTGGAHGIGKAYCLGFANAGARVVIADIDKPGAEAAAKEIGAQALALQVDVSNEDATKKMAAQTLERFGRVDILINNAAIFFRRADEPRPD
jgi:NAD(P)-dependent dehydrogenase (short-subunit alcohol dehydrogenase family)